MLLQAPVASTSLPGEARGSLLRPSGRAALVEAPCQRHCRAVWIATVAAAVAYDRRRQESSNSRRSSQSWADDSESDWTGLSRGNNKWAERADSRRNVVKVKEETQPPSPPAVIGRKGRSRMMKEARRGRNLVFEKEEFIEPESFAGIKVTGHAADWIRAQRELYGGKFEPTGIQEAAMKRIYEGESCVLHAATGTGKTLCYALPLIQRMLDEARKNQEQQKKREGGDLRMLVLCPGQHLIYQTVAIIRALVGPALASSVRAGLFREESLAELASTIVVTTPQYVSDLLKDQKQTRYWQRNLSHLDYVVVDEADRFLDMWTKRVREEYGSKKETPCSYVLQSIDELTVEADRRESWQLVAATATLGSRTRRGLMFSSGIELSTIRSLERKKEDSEEEHRAKMEDPGLMASNAFRPGSSILSVRHRVRPLKNWGSRDVMGVVCRSIEDLEAERTLVVICTEGHSRSVPRQKYNISMLLSNLKSNLPPFFNIMPLSSAVSEANEMWSSESCQKRLTERKRPDVIICIDNEVRGVHLDGVEFVLLLGLPRNAKEYSHIAGRTCRHQPGQTGEPPPGLVVSIVPFAEADWLQSWLEIMDINLVEVDPFRDQLIPPLDERTGKDKDFAGRRGANPTQVVPPLDKRPQLGINEDYAESLMNEGKAQDERPADRPEALNDVWQKLGQRLKATDDGLQDSPQP